MSMMDYYTIHTARVDNVITRKVFDNRSEEEARNIINKIWSYPDIKKELYLNCLELGSYALYNIDELISDALGIERDQVWVNLITGVNNEAFLRGFIGSWEYEKVAIAFKEIYLSYGLFAVCIDGMLYVWCPFDNYGISMQHNQNLVCAILGTKTSPNPLFKRQVPDVANINRIIDIVNIIFHK